MLKIIGLVRTILKYGGVLMAVIKAFEVLSDELEKYNNKKVANENKLLGFKIWLYIFVLRFFYGFSKIKTKVIYAQAKLETGNFTSAIFKENNNLFGMREAQKRKKTAVGTNRNHAVYKNHFKSVVDYFLRQRYFGINAENDVLFMASTVNSNYAEDVNYLEKWQYIVDKTKEPLFFTILVYGGFFFALVMTILVIKQNRK